MHAEIHKLRGKLFPLPKDEREHYFDFKSGTQNKYITLSKIPFEKRIDIAKKYIEKHNILGLSEETINKLKPKHIFMIAHLKKEALNMLKNHLENKEKEKTEYEVIDGFYNKIRSHELEDIYNYRVDTATK